GGVSGVVGPVILVFFASQLFAGTRLVLNRILHAKGHGFVHGTLYDLGMIVLLTVLFFVAIGVTAALAWVQGVVMLAEPKSWVATGFRWAGVGLALGLNTVLFLVLYRLVPHTPGPVAGAAAGSAGAAALPGAAEGGLPCGVRG